jgi:hypothetical protein
MLDGLDVASGADSLTSVLVAVVLLVTLVLVVVFVWPLLILLVELLAALVLFAVRFLLGRWTVVAETSGERHAWQVKGRARSAALVAEVATALRGGVELPGGGSFESRPSDHLAEEALRDNQTTGHVRVINEQRP